jgi:hypothetical protein
MRIVMSVLFAAVALAACANPGPTTYGKPPGVEWSPTSAR